MRPDPLSPLVWWGGAATGASASTVASLMAGWPGPVTVALVCLVMFAASAAWRKR